MVAVAVAMTADLDLRFQNAIADDLPAFLVNPTGGLEETERDRGRARGVRARRRHRAPSEGGGAEAAAGAAAAGARPAPRLHRHPAVVQHRRRQGALDRRRSTPRAQVVLIDFWTYTCINCIRTLPYVKAWDARVPRRRPRRSSACTRPSSPFEKDAGNVADAIAEQRDRLPRRPGQRARHLERLRQPVLAGEVPDRRRAATSATSTSARATTTRPSRRSARCWPRPATATSAHDAPTPAETADPGAATPETYLGSARAQGWSQRRRSARGARTTAAATRARLPPNQFAYGGRWEIGAEAATAGARSAASTLRFQARRVLPRARLTGAGRERRGPARRQADQRRRRRLRRQRDGAVDGRPASASTGSSSSTAPATTCSASSSRPGSPATRSRSASAGARGATPQSTSLMIL